MLTTDSDDCVTFLLLIFSLLPPLPLFPCIAISAKMEWHQTTNNNFFPCSHFHRIVVVVVLFCFLPHTKKGERSRGGKGERETRMKGWKGVLQGRHARACAWKGGEQEERRRQTRNPRARAIIWRKKQKKRNTQKKKQGKKQRRKTRECSFFLLLLLLVLARLLLLLKLPIRRRRHPGGSQR